VIVVIALLIQIVGVVEAALAVLSGVTVIMPLAGAEHIDPMVGTE
jgi:hypothetical protein